MTETESVPPKKPWLRILAIVWLGFISVFVITDHVALSRLRSPWTAGPSHAEWISAQTRISTLEAARNEPRPTGADPDARVVEAMNALTGRVTTLEGAHAEAVPSSEFNVLEDRIGALESQVARVRAVPRQSSIRKATRDDSSTPLPDVLGVEWRGGERFLAVTNRGGSALREVRLIRAGDTAGKWRLQSIESDAAVFAYGTRQERLHIP